MRQVIIKSVSFILLISCISTLFAGCEIISEDRKADKQALINQLMQDFGKTNDDSLEFVIDEIAQATALSASFSINVKIYNNKFYIRDILFDYVYIDNSPKISYDEEFLHSTNKTVTDEEVFEIMKKIQSCKSCYILESNDSDTKYSIYKINNNYYFLSFIPGSEEKFLRIHGTSIE